MIFNLLTGSLHLSFLCRRERDNLEAERVQHLKQIHELQGHIKEKESQFLALEEQVSLLILTVFSMQCP